MTVPDLLAVDGHNLLFRSWYGFPAQFRSRDESMNVTGVFGFFALLRAAQRDHADGHEVVVVFDAEDGAASRSAKDEAYKAQRAAPDPGLIASLPYIQSGLDEVGVRWVEQSGVEADDVIATLTANACRAGRAVDVMSGDKDFYQLLGDDRVRVLNTMLREGCRRLTGEGVFERFAVTAAQWPDYRALMGDPSDNIPGVRGVGPKSAARLLAGGRSLEQVPAGELRASWAEQWPDALRWREMIRLDCKVALPDDLVSGRSTPPLPSAPQTLQTLGLW